MAEARLRALTHLSDSCCQINLCIEMAEARLRALTPLLKSVTLNGLSEIEMAEARLRALTHSLMSLRYTLCYR